MDGDLGEKLSAILSDPAQMAQLTQMAQSLMGQMSQEAGGGTPKQEAAPAPASKPEQPADTRLLSALGRALAGGRGNTRSTALLTAMRPYMKPEKQEKLDRAMKIARMVNVAETVMREYGGGHGV